ncbi:MAG TPA: CpsD/CapB family tyrosine-protein kinase [Polyangiaceae bacterium]|nr:CpsD/CapB family tyrosine-protein kinase [Polyangiaceae bacterium]
MQQHERPSVATSLEIVPREEEIVRIVPVWASPPDMRVLAMLGEWRAAGPAASLRVIRHRLEQHRAAGMWTFGVTSARDGEGKTTLAAQLALVLCESQRARVLLVEANMHRPALARVLGFQVPPGLGFSVQLARRMRGGLEPWSVLAVGPALHVLVENESESGFPETLHSVHFKTAVERVGQSYDWVIVDAASVLGSGDANVVEEAVDGMIVAARSGSSSATDLRATMRQLGDRKAIGVVLWDVASRGRR